MFVQVNCGNCKQIIKAEEKYFGKTVKCPHCKTHLKIPDLRAAQVDPLIGKQIAHCQIMALLGRGAMGRVYRARNINLNRTCALKILPEDFAKQDQTSIDRFIREAQSAANVEHPNVLPVHYVGKEGETYFIEMQYVDGGTVEGLLYQRGRLGPAEAARIVRDVAGGLGAAHAKGIIHRDIKPSNVMVTKDGRVLVADFGLARMAQRTTAFTLSGMILGTPLYMSPEQAEAKPADHRSDIYSLGAMFYHLLVGRSPYVAETPPVLLNMHCNSPVPDVRDVVPEIPPELAAIVMRMMAKRPEDRYQNCAEIVDDLNSFLASPRAAGKLNAPTVRILAELGRAGRRRERKRSLVPWLMGLILGLIVVGVVVVVLAPKWKKQMAGPRKIGGVQTTKGTKIAKGKTEEDQAQSRETRDLSLTSTGKEPSTKATKEGDSSRQGAETAERRVGVGPSKEKAGQEAAGASKSPEQTELDATDGLREPAICKRGALLLRDDFSGGEVLWEFDPTMGEWKIENNALVRSAKTGSHPVGVSIGLPRPVKDVVTQFRALLPQDVWSFFVGYGPKSLRSPNALIQVRKKTFSLSTWDESAGQFNYIATSAFEYEEPRWVDVMFEVAGTRYALTLDGETITCDFAMEEDRTINRLEFKVVKAGADVLAIDDVSVWEALPKDDQRAPAAKAHEAIPPAKPETGALQVDLVSYLDDIKPVNERIENDDYVAARGRANLLKEKYPTLIEVKLGNLDRIEALRKRCFERVNSGAVKLSMGDIARKYAFAGEIKKADGEGLTAKISKRWESFEPAEVMEFYRKALDPRSAEDWMGLAALTMEGMADLNRLDAALDLLGKAKELGADVSILLTYVETLKQALEERNGKTGVRSQKEEGREQEASRRDAESAGKTPESGAEIQNPKSKIQNYDDVYVAVAATGEKIPHPLSRKTYAMSYESQKAQVPEGMALMPPGPFVMGDDSEDITSPAHVVDVGAFFIDKYEVTNAQYMEFVKTTGRQVPKHFAANGNKIPAGRENHPVVWITWTDAKVYCDWCGKRLPTEAEWEKAASYDFVKNKKKKYPWGDEDESARLPRANSAIVWGYRGSNNWDEVSQWWKTQSQQNKKFQLEHLANIGGLTKPVGTYRSGASACGCYDMVGNVGEWISDWFERYPGNNRFPPKALTLCGMKTRVTRGGGWWSPDSTRYCVIRWGCDPVSYGDMDLGFRCAADCTASLKVHPPEGGEKAERKSEAESGGRHRSGGKASDVAVARLIQKLLNGEPKDQAEAATELGELGDRRAVEPLVTVLNRRIANQGVGQCAATALGQLGDRRALEALIDALRNGYKNLRAAAADALGELGDDRAIGPLEAALKDSEEVVRKSAAAALYKVRESHQSKK